MAKLVLVGIDPGYRDVSALQWALEWATATKQDLLVVSGFEIGQAEIPPEFHDEMLAEAHALIDAKIDSVEKEHRAPTQSLIVEGHPAQVVIDAVHSRDPSLVVLGSFGDGGYDQYAVGGVAHEVMAKLSRPVALVRHVGGHITGGEMIVGYDGTAATDDALKWVLNAARSTGARVTVVATGGTAVPEVSHRVEELAGHGIEAQIITVPGDHVDELRRLGDERSAAMIVVGSNGAGRLRELLAGDDGARLIERSDRPVVIVHQSN